VLGILEHASRAALCLEALQSKSSWTLILKLIEAIRRHGKPRAVRTDNEAGLRVPDVLPGTAPPRHRASANRSRLPLAEWPGRALVRHAEGEARSARGRFIRSAQRCSCRVPLLLQPRPLAPASRRPDARPSSPSERILVRSLGWAARRLLLTKVTPEPARKKNGALRTARRLSGRNASRSHIDKKFEEGKSYKPKKIGRRHKNSRRSRS